MTVMTEVTKIASENWFYRRQLAVIDQLVTLDSNDNVWSLNENTQTSNHNTV
jgi:hypothetical protein